MDTSAITLATLGAALVAIAQVPGIPLPQWVLGIVGVLGGILAGLSFPGPGQVRVNSLPAGVRGKVKAAQGEGVVEE
jgi:hypothetical protein